METVTEPVEPKVETPPAETSEKPVISVEEFQKMQAALKEANKEAAARRKKIEEYEAEEAKRKEAEMSEAEKAKAEAERERNARTELEAKLNAINMERDFSKATKALQFEYANEQAEKDALGYLKSDNVTAETMEEALKKLSQDRPYLFKVRQEKPNIDAQAKGEQIAGEMTEARKKELTQRFPSLG